MRRTKIVCTIGPATSSEAQLEQLMRAGMNVARLNFSHGTHQEHEQVIERVRAISARLDYAVAILQDLQGPKIRIGTLQDGKPVTLVVRLSKTLLSSRALETRLVLFQKIARVCLFSRIPPLSTSIINSRSGGECGPIESACKVRQRN